MNEAKHTPGPWSYCKADDDGCQCGQIWSPDGNTNVAIATHVSQCGADDLEAQELFVQDLKETKANARLIAAAPEMLEALKSVLNAVDVPAWMHSLSSEEEAIEQIKAAIAKATGERK